MPETPIADQASRDIIRGSLDTNILVEAGAGSGKTEMLAERMAAGVASGVYQVEHMAAVTFTRKAASELRGRFHLALERLLQPHESRAPLDAESAARVHRALSNLERFFAGTIHAFCARLLRERPVESGVAPGFSELDEVQDLDLPLPQQPRTKRVDGAGEEALQVGNGATHPRRARGIQLGLGTGLEQPLERQMETAAQL